MDARQWSFFRDISSKKAFTFRNEMRKDRAKKGSWCRARRVRPCAWRGQWCRSQGDRRQQTSNTTPASRPQQSIGYRGFVGVCRPALFALRVGAVRMCVRACERVSERASTTRALRVDCGAWFPGWRAVAFETKAVTKRSARAPEEEKEREWEGDRERARSTTTTTTTTKGHVVRPRKCARAPLRSSTRHSWRQVSTNKREKEKKTNIFHPSLFHSTSSWRRCRRRRESSSRIILPTISLVGTACLRECKDPSRESNESLPNYLSELIYLSCFPFFFYETQLTQVSFYLS